VQRDHSLYRKMLASMAMRLRQLMNDVESYSLHSGKQRIIGFLLREVPESDNEGLSIVVTLPTNKGVIASRLNLTQEISPASCMN
jgi:CRP-like cAMP-binding protein